MKCKECGIVVQLVLWDNMCRACEYHCVYLEQDYLRVRGKIIFSDEIAQMLGEEK